MKAEGEKMEMKKRCELCGDAAATMYCESDAASLCLRCDEKVHGANFLVAKHERSLLCSVCQSVTSWKASGPRLGRTVSVCDGCVRDRNGDGGKVEAAVEEVESRDRSDGDEEPDGSSSDDEDDEEEEEEVEEDEEDEENQVVPCSSGEEVASSSICGGVERCRELKRRRDVSDLDSDEEVENGGGSSNMDWDRTRAASRPIGLNRFSDRDFRVIKPTASGIRAGNQTSRISE